MTRKKEKVDPPTAATLRETDHYRLNRLILEWLEDDEHRTRLFGIINAEFEGRLEIPGRDAAPRTCDCAGVDKRLPEPRTDHKPVLMITGRAPIVKVLLNKDERYSNRVYAELGGGSFMLALDPHLTSAHAEQKEVFSKCFPDKLDEVIKLSHAACQAAAIMALQAPEFDLAYFAEQSALRFCQKTMGFAVSDYPLLETGLRAAYRALTYQVMGRHFVTEPLTIPAGKQEMGKLLTRTSALIDAYATKKADDDALKGCKDRSVPAGFDPVLKKLGSYPGRMNGEQRAIIAMGAAIGTIGNVQAAACIAVKAIFDDSDLRDAARALAEEYRVDQAIDKLGLGYWQRLIQDSLRENPPIPFLPRLLVDGKGTSEGEVLLALGGGTMSGPGGDDPLIWGIPTDGKHWCSGMMLAWPLIIEIVRQVMALPGLAQRLDPLDATPIGLKKRWGFACESYPLTHRRDRRVAQGTLNVAMRLKWPVRDSADRVRLVIAAGAPRIEEALREARQVHFAWFELIESDSVLVLHTVYDGPFDAYIQDFALKVGDLFDLLFEWIEAPPPMPVGDFPNEFVAHIQRFNRAPAMGYFFSAYPRSEVSSIIRNQLGRP